MNKASGGDGIPVELFQILKDDAVKDCTQYTSKFGKLSSGHRTLVLINFCTQLGVDLIFSFFSKHFNIHKTIRIMPFITAIGLCVYAIMPTISPNYAFVGLVIGTDRKASCRERVLEYV